MHDHLARGRRIPDEAMEGQTFSARKAQRFNLAGMVKNRDEVLARLAPRHGVELVHVTDEDEYFPPPRNIRELQAAIGTAATVLLGGPTTRPARSDDRTLAASTVLRALDA